MRPEKAICFVLFLAGCSSAPLADNHLAVITTSCGYTDGGAYDISVDLGNRDLTLHAEGVTAEEWQTPSSLKVLICDRTRDSCDRPKSGVLRLSRSAGETLAGTLSFELIDGGTESIHFQGVPKKPEPPLICG